MANVKISEMTVADTPLGGNESFPILQNGENKLTTLADIVAGITGGIMPGDQIKVAYEAEPDTNAFSNADVVKLGNIETNADVTDATNVALALTAGTNITISTGGIVAATDTNYISSDFTHNDLTGFVANEHIDWTTDQGGTNIHAGNYTDTVYDDTAISNAVDLNTAKETNIVHPLVETAVPAGALFTDTNTVYAHPNHSGEVTSTADGATVIADNMVDEANLKISNTPTDGYVLTAQSGNAGGLTWAAAGSGGGGAGGGHTDASVDAHLNKDTASTGEVLSWNGADYVWVPDANTNTTYVSGDFTHNDLTGFVANEHIDWTTDQGGTNIHAGNYTDTNTVYDDTAISNAVDLNTAKETNIVHPLVETAVPAGAVFTDTIYTHPNHSGEVTSSTDGATVIVDNMVDEANLKISNTPIDGYVLTAQSGNAGGLTWAAAGAGGYTDSSVDANLNTNTANTGEVLSWNGADYVWVPDANTNTTYVSGDFTHNDLSGFVADEHIDWTTDQGATNIHASNYTDTVYDDTALSDAVDLNTAKETNIAHPLVETAVPVGAVFTDTVYDDTALSDAVDLNTAKETNIAHPLVETAVPVGAVFTDTVYDDTALSDAVDLNTAKETNIAHPLVETAVPAGAVFTDTVYDDTALSDAVDLNTAKETNIAHPLVETAVPVGATFTDTVYDDTALSDAVDLNTAKETNIVHPLVETAVPVGAVFTDTVYDDTALSDAVDLNTAKETNIVHPLVETAVPAGAVFTDTTYVSSDFTHDNLTGVVANEHIDWTTDQGATNIHAGNYTDTDTIYIHPNHSGEVTSTSDGATVIVDNIVDEANLKVSNAPTNRHILTAQSGNTGGMTWVDPDYETVGTLTGVTLNLGTGTVFAHSPATSPTYGFDSPPASGTAYGFTLKVSPSGTVAISWPASVVWAGGTAPDAPASGAVNVYTFYTQDGGITWFGFLAGAAMS